MFNTDTDSHVSGIRWSQAMTIVATALVVIGLVLPSLVSWSLDNALANHHLTGPSANASIAHQAQMECLTYSANPSAC